MRTRWEILPLTAILWLGAAQAGSVQPVDSATCIGMKSHHVLNDGAPVGCDRLAVVTFNYVDFFGAEHTDGKIVVLYAVAESVARIFDALHARHFPIAKAQPMEVYDGDDEAAMADNNTSAFNHRNVPGSARLSLHAYGVAIDLNPVENPFITRNGATFTVHPPRGADYVNRLTHLPWKPDHPGVAEDVVKIFADNGFMVWGGYWDDPIDYQHFDIGRPLAEELAELPPAAARARFETYLTCRVTHCDQNTAGQTPGLPR